MGVRTFLTVDQRTRYKTLKREIQADIETGIAAFERVAAKLFIVRDEKLYREEFDTWEEFCRETLGKSKTHVNRMIQAHDVIRGLLAAGEVVRPESEHLARHLSKYLKRDRQLIWRRAKQIADRENEKQRTRLSGKQPWRLFQLRRPKLSGLKTCCDAQNEQHEL
jgi:hypothetical protein